MIHLQQTTDGWLEAIWRLPDRSLVKAVDQGQEFIAVKQIAAQRGITVYTCLRHWYDTGQVFGGTYEANKQRARDFFDTFIDGTFINQIAPHCDYIEEFNEYLANSQNAQEILERVTWARAAADVWLNEYRIRPELAHIKLVLCNTAVGNWIDREFAVVASAFDATIGYHPYTAWGFNAQPKTRWSEDWEALSGLWHFMEQDWGINVEWVFTEAGPFQSAVDGWRSSSCLDGDVTAYISSVREWLRDVQTTPAYQAGRTKGFALFTTDRPNDGSFASYRTGQPELNLLANMVATEWFPGTTEPEPEPDPDPECSGLPREQYTRTFNVIPSSATEELATAIFLEGWKRGRETTGGSYDDAGIGDLNNKNANLYGIDNEQQQIFTDWFDEHYPGTNVVFKAIPVNGQEPQHSIIDIVDSLSMHSTRTYQTRNLSEITTLTIHHTVSPPDRSIESIASYHVNGRGWPGIGYHFVLKDDGAIYQTNYLDTVSYHAGSYNAPGDENLWSVGISLQGDFTDAPPPQAQLDAAKWLVEDLKRQLGPLGVLPHRGMPGAQTACPGATWESWFSYVAGTADIII